MGKNKLKKFAETFTFDNFIQPSYDEIKDGYSLKGKWVKEFFKNKNPIILELGCGKGEYTVGLAQLHPENNYIGIDIKGSRMWLGGKISNEKKIKNVAFVRTKIENIEHFFAKDEISEIWITFPTPQPKTVTIKKRLTSPQFLKRYFNIIKNDAIIHLKTDSRLIFDYTLKVIEKYNHNLITSTFDLYNSDIKDDVILIRTYYEKKFLEENIPINYLKFSINPETVNKGDFY